MSIRVWALWGRPIKLGIALAVTFASLIIVTGVVSSRSTASHAFYAVPGLAALPGCLAIGADKTLSAAFIFLVVYEALTFGLTITKRIQLYLSVQVGSRTSSVMHTMVTDGAIYFATLLSISLINIILFITAPPEITGMQSVQQMVLHALLSARTLIHLREQSSVAGKSEGGVSSNPGDLEFHHSDDAGEHSTVNSIP
ncbi:hypothetical protein HGRIS_009130 [Hohenbuehelia grisea]|uniref:Integral membrane protein n=1 Tax=Hohenbuehelia grisea TaxID=104357 RepID=A0ABR3J067_9AGAR